MRCTDNTFRTVIPVDNNSPVSMNTQSRVLLAGSCFSDNIGARLAESGMTTRVNPAGALYNPASIAAVLRAAMADELPDDTIFDYDGRTRCWLFPTKYSDTNPETACSLFRDTLSRVREALLQADIMIFTFGTAWVYRHIPSDISSCDGIVSNCHKVPARHFRRFRLSVSDIATDWTALLAEIRQLRGRDMQVIFTVSPIRHFKDGAYENTLSKATLQLAVSEIINSSTLTDYFPAYELMMDDLRDYRFYADDMLHPSDVGIDYIWQHFQATYFSHSDRQALAAAARQFKRTQHRNLLDS